MRKEYIRQLGKKLLILTLLLVTLSISALAADNDYLTFQSEDDKTFTLKTSNETKNWKNKLEYSNDGTTWAEWDGETIDSSSDGKLYLRGTGNTVITGATEEGTSKSFVFGGESKKIACTGNIMTLLDYEKPNGVTMGSCCFDNLFGGCTALTSAPELPAEKLASYCYRSMFYGCTALTNAPELPATTLAEACYDKMFAHCTSLVSAPALPAKKLVNQCYKSMFYQCTSLQVNTTAPTDSNYVVWNFPSDAAATSWNTGMLTNTGGDFYRKNGMNGDPKLGVTYYVAGDVDAVSFKGYTFSEIADKYIQFTFDGMVTHPRTKEQVNTLTTADTLAELFESKGISLQDLDGKISFGVTVKGLSNGVHVAGAEFVD